MNRVLFITRQTSMLTISWIFIHVTKILDYKVHQSDRRFCVELSSPSFFNYIQNSVNVKSIIPERLMKIKLSHEKN